MRSSNIKWWIVWLLLSLGVAAYYGYALISEDKTALLPGTTSHGHYQIELACGSCHGEAFAGGEALQTACINCHGDQMKAARDSHPRSKFTDPRNADRVALLDARYCITCHREHKPEVTDAMGVTLPNDLCFICHKDIAQERASHNDISFDSCASAGCHNYHDNQALYEAFLVKHGNEPAHLTPQRVPERNLHQWNLAVASSPVTALAAGDADAPVNRQLAADEFQHWVDSGHATAGVNCSACHQQENKNWIDKPGVKICESCHKQEVSGFTAGKHGMRLAQGMSPMVPAMARLPMKVKVAKQPLDCNSCHGAHQGGVKEAVVDACMGCHDDEHSRHYLDSPHAQLWQQEQAGLIAVGSGVSCATCHMPRAEVRQLGERHVAIQHNQSLNLRPNEKMVRSVCMHCHGYQFAINALADGALIKNNFSSSPTVEVKSVQMALARDEKRGTRSK